MNIYAHVNYYVYILVDQVLRNEDTSIGSCMTPKFLHMLIVLLLFHAIYKEPNTPTLEYTAPCFTFMFSSTIHIISCTWISYWCSLISEVSRYIYSIYHVLRTCLHHKTHLEIQVVTLFFTYTTMHTSSKFFAILSYQNDLTCMLLFCC